MTVGKICCCSCRKSALNKSKKIKARPQSSFSVVISCSKRFVRYRVKKSPIAEATGGICCRSYRLVRATGLEPAHLAALEPKSNVSASSTTPAYNFIIISHFQEIVKYFWEEIAVIGILSKIFIRDYKNVSDPEVRRSYGVLTGAVGIALNILLFIGKFFAGLITSSIAVTADAFNNLSDAGASIISIVGFKMAGMPADREHPFGHGRIEYVAGLIMSVVILFMGYELGRDSVMKIIEPEEMSFSWISLGILIASVLVKLYICLYNRKIGRLINSTTMKAAAMDSLSDCISTGAVIVGLIVYAVTSVSIDGYVGVVVAVFILKTGLDAAKESLTPLIGEKPDPEYVADIRDTVLSHEGITGVHDLIVHNYGVGANIISLHAEVPADMGFVKAHELIDIVENELKKKYASCATIHMDPVEAETEDSVRYRRLVEKILSDMGNGITMHDFRMTNGKLNRNLIFDIIVPFESKISAADAVKRITECVESAEDGLNVVINVDRQMY